MGDTYKVLASYAGKKSNAKLRMPSTLINGFGFKQPTYAYTRTDGTLCFEIASAPDKILKSWGTPFQAWIKHIGAGKYMEKEVERKIPDAINALQSGE